MSAPAAYYSGAAASHRMGEDEVPAHFGDPAVELEAARSGAAIAPRAGRELFRVAGADRATFLQGLLTNDVVGVATGDGCQTLFLDNKGHVRAVLDLWAEADALIGATDNGFIDAVLPDLARYVLAADVQISDLRPQQQVLGLWGPNTEAVLEGLGITLSGTGAHAHVQGLVGGAEVRVACTPSLGGPGCEFHVDVEDLDAVWAALESAAGDNVAHLGWDAAEALRMEAGVSRRGHEVTGEEFPQELHLNGSVDYEKGCYLGQETVARIHYRGQVNRLLGVLRSDSPLSAGAELLSSGKPVGSLTSAVDMPPGGAIGLGMVRRDEYEAGAVLQVKADDEVVAEAVVASPPIDA